MIKDAVYTNLSNSQITFETTNKIRKKEPPEFGNLPYKTKVCLSGVRCCVLNDSNSVILRRS